MLDDKFIQERKKELEKEKKRLEEELSHVAEKVDGEYEPLRPDYGSKEEDTEAEDASFETNIGIEEKLEGLLDATNRALEKMKEGKYGICEECGEEIDPARLKAFPAAGTCLSCSKRGKRKK